MQTNPFPAYIDHTVNPVFPCIRKTIPFLVNLRKYKDLLDEMQVKCYTNIQRQRLTFAQNYTTGETDASYIRFTRGYMQQ